MKKMFKSLFVLVTILTFSVMLAACKTTESTTEQTTAGSTTARTTRTTTQVTTQGPTTTQYDGDTFDGAKVRIMCQIIAECNPFDEAYTGRYQAEKQALQTATEAKYDVEIEYVTFPSDAGWGPARIDAIINASTAQQPLAHMYQLTTSWMGQLVNGGALAPVSNYIRDYANENYDDNQNTFGKYNGEVYGFDSTWVLNDTAGLYYNYDLLQELELDSPAKLWNEGKWNWTAFKNMVIEAQAALDSKTTPHYAMGGNYAQIAQNFVGANGGYLINPHTDQVSFNETASLQALTFLNEVYQNNVWEPAPAFDAGSSTWLEGKVLFHFGELWFTNSAIRWGEGTIGFDLGYVPFPIGDNADLEDYNTPKMGQVMWFMSSGYDEATVAEGELTDEYIFRIWNDLQYYQTYEDRALDFEITIEQSYDDPESVEANISVLNKVYNERIFGIGIGGFGADEWYTIAGQTVMNGDANTRLSAMKPKYDAALDTYLGR